MRVCRIGLQRLARQPQRKCSAHSAIPFRSGPGGMYVYVGLGGVPHNMVLDTGAGISQVTVPIARDLVARGEAVVLPGFLQRGKLTGPYRRTKPSASAP